MSTEPTIILPPAVRLHAQALGAVGSQWIADLDDTVRELQDAWALRVGPPLSGGSASLVLLAERTDGTPAVLKLGLPESGELAHQARVLRLADGRGYARLLEHDSSHNAVLVERLGAALATEGHPTKHQMETICQTLKQAWISLEMPDGFTTGAGKARGLADYIDGFGPDADVPCSAPTRDRAVAFAHERGAAYNPTHCVLAHGDGHAENTLHCPMSGRDAASSYRFVDPDGLFIERAYDLGILMRGFNAELLAGDTILLGRQRCDWLAELTKIDPQPIWQWGFIERVSTGLFLWQTGRHELATQTLAVADRWAASVL